MLLSPYISDCISAFLSGLFYAFCFSQFLAPPRLDVLSKFWLADANLITFREHLPHALQISFGMFVSTYGDRFFNLIKFTDETIEAQRGKPTWSRLQISVRGEAGI